MTIPCLLLMHNGEPRKEDAMTPLSPSQVEREHDHSLSLLVALLLAALDFFPTVDDRNAAAAECLAAELTEPRPVLELSTWSSLSPRILPPVIWEQDGRQRLPASSACAAAPSLADGPIARARIRDQGIGTIGAAVGQSSRTSATVNRASTTDSRTMKPKSRIPTVKIGVHPHSGKKHASRASTSPIEIEAEIGERPAAVIGPRDEHSGSQTSAEKLFPPAPVARSRRQPVDLSNPLRRVLPQPGYDGESNRMNSTTTLALHGGECAYGCP